MFFLHPRKEDSRFAIADSTGDLIANIKIVAADRMSAVRRMTNAIIDRCIDTNSCNRSS